MTAGPSGDSWADPLRNTAGLALLHLAGDAAAWVELAGLCEMRLAVMAAAALIRELHAARCGCGRPPRYVPGKREGDRERATMFLVSAVLCAPYMACGLSPEVADVAGWGFSHTLAEEARLARPADPAGWLRELPASPAGERAAAGLAEFEEQVAEPWTLDY